MSPPESPNPADAVAVIGLAGRFPGARDVDELWAALREGRSAIRRLSRAELISAGVDEKDIDDPRYVAAAGVMEGADLFDAALFGVSPKEAALIDPQQRVFLECAWTALEHAGYGGRLGHNQVGVFAGSGWNSYLLRNLASHANLFAPGAGQQTLLGNDKDNLATRVCYKLDLRGPGVTLQTGCSTSLVACVAAYHALLSYQCDIALAGGVSVTVPQGGYHHLAGSIFSPDGVCRAFDKDARGTVLGSGVGVVVLKRLPEAIADGDTIHAIIRGAAMNNDGSQKAGYTAPGVEGQTEVILAAQSIAGVPPETISLVEAHGTGTALGDPIEFAALCRAFRARTERAEFCALGSIKTNIGHLDAAAGVAGLIKAILALKHQELPPTLNFQEPAEGIVLKGSPFFVNTELRPWPEADTPRRAGVSSFGLGGTNAHVVLEEAPPLETRTSQPEREEIVLVSARSRTALDAATSALTHHFQANPQLALGDVSHTLKQGRRHQAVRRFVMAHDVAQAAERLRAATSVGETGSQAPHFVFLFGGQGEQHVNMARAAYSAGGEFRRIVDRCLTALLQRHGLDLKPVLFPDPSDADGATARLNETDMAQPALFVCQYALAHCWMNAGVKPAAVLGHSLGELVAAAVAEVLSEDDALDLVVARGSLMQSTEPGAMLAIAAPLELAGDLLVPGVAIAAINGPAAWVASGTLAAIALVEGRTHDLGIPSHRLPATRAFHSALMEPALAAYGAALLSVQLGPARIPLISTVSGRLANSAELTSPAYWADQARRTVRFDDALAAVGDLDLGDGSLICVDFGPRGVAGQLLKAGGRLRGRARVITCAARQTASPADGGLLRPLGEAWLAGAEINWPAVSTGDAARRVPLPTYPFERQRYWIDRRREPAAALEDDSVFLAEAAEASTRGIMATLDVDAHRARREALDGLSRHYMRAALHELGCAAESWPEGAERVDARYHSLIGGWVEELRHTSGDALQPGPDEAVPSQARARWAQWPHVVAQIERCGASLTSVLRGDLAPAALFSDVDTAADARPEALLDEPFRGAAVGILEKLATRRGGPGLRILEVGGGSGIATRDLLKMLPPETAGYTFTDISAALVRRAAREFGAYGFADFRTLDLNAVPTDQGFVEATYDAIVAVNMLHATADIGRSLRHLRSLLAPGGILLIWEIVTPTLDFMISYGLLMEPPADAGRTTARPFLTVEGWREALRTAGLSVAQVVPEALDIGQAIVVARAPLMPLTAVATGNRLELAKTAVAEKDGDIGNWFHTAAWRQLPYLPLPVSTAESVLLFARSGAFGDRLAAQLRSLGVDVTQVRCGSRYRETSPRTATLRPGADADYRRLVAMLKSTGQRPRRIVQAWSVGSAERPLTSEAVDSAIREGIGSLAALARALDAAGWARDVEIITLTEGVYDVTGAEPIAPANALLVGGSRVIPLEYPGVTARIVDLEAGRSAPNGGAALNLALVEILAAGAPDVVALRGDRRWTVGWARQQAPLPPGDGALRPEGVYVITGGLGAIGLTIAEHLATRVGARLALLNRSAFPPRACWDEKLASLPHDDAVARRIRVLRRIETFAPPPLVLQVDVADEAQTLSAARTVHARLGPVNGVVHAAGVLGDGSIERKTLEAIGDVLRPKVSGALSVRTAFAGSNLDFLAFCSSNSANSPGFGQLAYCAANNFLDALARQDASQGRRTLSIGWDVWQGEGMAYHATPSQLVRDLKATDFERRGILPAEGAEAFLRAIAQPRHNIAVLTTPPRDGDQLGRIDLVREYLDGRSDQVDSGLSYARPDVSTPWRAAKTDEERELLEIWESLLGFDRIGTDDDFFELGGDSLIGTQLIARVRDSFGVTLSVKTLYENPSVRRLVVALTEALLADTDEATLDSILEATT